MLNDIKMVTQNKLNVIFNFLTFVLCLEFLKKQKKISHKRVHVN